MKLGKAPFPGLLRRYLSYVGATVASLLVYSLYSMADGLFVSRGVNEIALSAVNLALPCINVLFSVAVIFAVGSSTIIAIHISRREYGEANRLFTQNTVILLAAGVIATALILIFLDPFTRLLGADENTFAYTRDYLRGIAPFSVFFMVSYNMEILIKTDGYPKKAMWTVISGCLLNFLLDYLAIFVLDMGTYGAAVATGMSQMFVCIIYMRHFLREKTTFRFCRFKMDRRIYRRLIPLGIPDGITEICNGLMIYIFNLMILRCLGENGLICYTIISYTGTVVINILIGVSSAAQPLVSYHHGGGRDEQCRALLRYALQMAGAIQLAVYLLQAVGGMLLIRAFLGGGNPVLNSTALFGLHRYSLCFLLMGANIVCGGYLTARECPRAALLISIGRGFALPTAALLLLGLTIGGDSIWLAPFVGELLCLLLTVLLMRKKSI